MKGKACPVCGQTTTLGSSPGGAAAGESAEIRDWCRAIGLDEEALCGYCRIGRVPSPCIGLCQLDRAGAVCLGCRRTADEIGSWVTLGPVARAQAWRRLRASIGGRP